MSESHDRQPSTQPQGGQPWPPPAAGTPSGWPPPGAREPARSGPGWAVLVVAVLVAALVGAGAALVGARVLDDDPPSSAALQRPSSAEQVDPPVQSSGDGSAPDWVTVAEAVAPSVVTIQVAGQGGSGEGSGVVFEADGSILTNNHVVAGAGAGSRIQVVLNDGRVFPEVEVVGTDPATDLAVLRLADAPADLTVATLGDSSKVVPGQPVMAVGNPLGLSDTVTTGIVSAVDRPVTTRNEPAQGAFRGSAVAEPVVTNAIQTDAAINPGNSGGALVDATGTVIGINSSIASTGGGAAGNIGLGFAIPVNEAKRIADELVENGTATHAGLGVEITDGGASTDGENRLAAVVAKVVPGSPAEQAGLQPGDAVVAVDGEIVNGAESLTAQVRERAPGTEVSLTVIRDDGTEQLPVTLGTRES